MIKAGAGGTLEMVCVKPAIPIEMVRQELAFILEIGDILVLRSRSLVDIAEVPLAQTSEISLLDDQNSQLGKALECYFDQIRPLWHRSQLWKPMYETSAGRSLLVDIRKYGVGHGSCWEC